MFAIDLLGFGRSDKPLMAYTIVSLSVQSALLLRFQVLTRASLQDLWRDLVNDFVREVAGGPAILIGNSIGSLVCLAVRTRPPFLG